MNHTIEIIIIFNIQNEMKTKNMCKTIFSTEYLYILTTT